jgi:hypothetical protein
MGFTIYLIKRCFTASPLKSRKLFIISNEKKFYRLITNVSIEYYSRQLSFHNFCIHNMKTSKDDMYVYSENFALKGPNDTISFVNYYLKENNGMRLKMSLYTKFQLNLKITAVTRIFCLRGGAKKIKRAKTLILKYKIIYFYPSKCFSNQFLKILRKY